MVSRPVPPIRRSRLAADQEIVAGSADQDVVGAAALERVAACLAMTFRVYLYAARDLDAVAYHGPITVVM